MHWAYAFAILGRLAYAKNRKPEDFDWNNVVPSKDLHFVECYNGLHCARLLTPLDWFHNATDHSVEKFVTLALIKRPAVVSQSHPSFGGAIITNPGGPGDSGILSVLTNGEFIQNMMDSEEKHFEIWSFDPRGMGFSLPVADCVSSEFDRALVDAQSIGRGLPDKDSNASLAMHKATEAALSMQCLSYTQNKDGFSIQEYMSTAYVARDMLHMVDKLDQANKNTYLSIHGNQLPLLHDSKQQRLPRLQYYGTSYGTYVGQTFLAMFPGRVRRMVLDGVVTPEDYTSGNWCTALEDTTTVFDYFYRLCFDAGERCPLRASSDRSWEDLKSKIERLISRLNNAPEPVSYNTAVPLVVSGQMIREAMVDSMYVPLLFHESVAGILAQALEGNYSSIISRQQMNDASQYCETPRTSGYTWMDFASLASRCSDGDDLRDRDSSYWRRYMDECENRSPEMGRVWTVGCSGWTIRPKHRFAGPFVSPAANSSDVEGHPSAPVLFLSSKIDPVTPLSAARQAAKSHPGSGIVIQDSVGHCAMLSSPSRCTNRKVSAYMANGVVPEDEEWCDADCVPWEKCESPVARLPR